MISEINNFIFNMSKYPTEFYIFVLSYIFCLSGCVYFCYILYSYNSSDDSDDSDDNNDNNDNDDNDDNDDSNDNSDDSVYKYKDEDKDDDEDDDENENTDIYNFKNLRVRFNTMINTKHYIFNLTTNNRALYFDLTLVLLEYLRENSKIEKPGLPSNNVYKKEVELENKMPESLSDNNDMKNIELEDEMPKLLSDSDELNIDRETELKNKMSKSSDDDDKNNITYVCDY